MFAAALAAALLFDAFVRDEPVPRGDERIYELMATDPGATHTFPFAYRVLVPWLVHVLPGSTTAGFQWLAWLSAAAAAACLFALLERLALPRAPSAALAVSLAVAPVLLVAFVRQGRSADPATVLVMCTAGLCIAARAPRALCALMLVGAFERESALFLAPWAYAVWARSLVDRAALARVAWVAAPAFAAYAALRLSIPTVGREQVVGYGSGLLQGRLDVLDQQADAPFTTLRRVALAFGPLWLAAPFALRSSAWVRRGLVLVGLTLVACTFALDWGRILVLAAPVVIPAAALALVRRPAWTWPVIGAWWAVIVGYAVYLQVHGVEANIIGGGTPAYPVR